MDGGEDSGEGITIVFIGEDATNLLRGTMVRPPHQPGDAEKPSSESSERVGSRQPAENNPAGQQWQERNDAIIQDLPAAPGGVWHIRNPIPFLRFGSTTTAVTPTAASPSDSRAESEHHRTAITFLRSLNRADRESTLRAAFTDKGWLNLVYGSISEHMYQFMHTHSRFPCPHERPLQAALIDLSEHAAHIKALDQAHDAERSRHRRETTQLAHQLDTLRLKLQDTEALYLRSLANVGGGLEPVADRTFADRFTDYHVAVNKWCRHNLRGRTKLAASALPERLKEVLRKRCATEDQWRAMSLGRATEVLVWCTVEDRAVRPWAGPVTPSAHQNNITGLESIGRRFEHEGNPEHSAKVDFWRSYTATLAFQSRYFDADVERCLADIIDKVLSDIAGIVVPDSAAPQLALDDYALRDILREVVVTVAEMKCQRGLFEPENVRLGARFRAESMDDCSGEEWEEGERKRGLVVKAVLSDGIIKRPYRDAQEVVGRACKARVLVGPA